MTWRDGPVNTSTTRPHDGWMRQFLRREAEAQASMLSRLRARLERDLERTEESQAVPDEGFVRAARLYVDGYRVLATLELETAKVRLLAERAKVHAPMTDEQFTAQIEALGRQAVGALSVEELEAELARKRALPAPVEP